MAKARRELQPLGGKPFTLAHFVAWAGRLVLDNGEPLVLEPFQLAFIEDVFSGVPECWFILPEGNGKTTLIAALVLYHIEFTPEAWVPVAAASREQAEIAYRQAAGFVERSPSLKDRFRCFDGYRRIVFKGTADGKINSRSPKIQIFAADEKTGDGVIPTLCVIDEPHRQHNMGLYRTWRGKLGKRGGQIIAISTAGEPGSEFETARENIRKLAAIIERTSTFVRAKAPSLIFHEWAIPEGGDVEDLDLVKAANPFSGVTVDSLREKRESPTMTLSHWRRFVCNLPTRDEDSAITEVEWRAAATTETIPPGQPIWLGIDVAWKWDTTALVPLWMRDEFFRLFGPARVLVPPRTGDSMSPNLIKRAVLEIHAANPIHTVVMDMTNAEDVAAWIFSEIGCAVIDRVQSNAHAALDYEKFMEALRNGWLKHSGDASLTKHAMNAIADMLPNGKARFDRPTQTRQGGDQERRVIDALTAASMVHTTAAAGEGNQNRWEVV